MKRNNLSWQSALAGVLLSSSLPVNLRATAQAADPLIMVANKSNPASALSKNDAKKVLLGETASWSNGAKVTVVFKGQAGPDHAAVLQKVCGMTEIEFTRFQLQIMFSGHTPTSLQDEPSAAATKAFIKANTGAVGFLHRSQMDKDLKPLLTLE